MVYRRIGGALLLLVAVACGDDDDDPAADSSPPASDAGTSGRACSLGFDAGSMTVIASPALECDSRTCIHVADQSPDLCGAPCTSVSDCIPAETTPCSDGFVCDFVVAQGPFACQTFCVCRAYVPDGGLAPSCQ